ncbi:MAG: NAD(P)H-hydrate dehydratase [Clostridia bacterium]|nr:NAD(P)H-hydrate dehydratase [Clostridia bacterium]
MKKIVSAEKMRQLERKVFDLGVDSFAVMEKAALRIADEIAARFDSAAKIIAVCGKGNNGGDGLAVARMLKMAGYDITVCLPFGEPATADAQKNLEIVKKLDINITQPTDFAGYDVIIDALLGTGLSKDVESDIPEKINSSGAYVVAADIPSGINSDTGEVCKAAVKADLTVALGFKKYGHSVYPGKEYCGETVVCDIGIPFDGESDTFETDLEFVKSVLPVPKKDAHKGDMGKLSVIAGSRGFTGAATLCCEAALKSGCGLVTLFTPENLNEIYEKKLTEAMTLPLSCENFIDADLVLEHADRLKSAGAVIIGPGLGRDTDAQKVIKFLFENEIPMVIDADGINAVSGNINVLYEKKGEVILTPHMGEFSRLTGLPTEEILSDRLGLARKFAAEYGVTLVLKGAGTVIALPDGKAYINHTGNSGMATGGSGDVLSGIIGAFLARGIGAPKSAVAAVYIHGLAGDIAAEKLGCESMLPTDIIGCLPRALMIKNQES